MKPASNTTSAVQARLNDKKTPASGAARDGATASKGTGKPSSKRSANQGEKKTTGAK